MNQENVATAYLHDQAKKQLLSVVERIERMEVEKNAIADDIKEIMKEAKGNGFCAKTIKKIIALRKKEEHERLEEEAMMLTYMQALGMIPQLADTPLGQASVKIPAGKAQEAQEAAKTEAASQASRDLDNARRRGLQAGRSDIPETENPYLFDDPRHKEWESGRAEAAGQKELVAA